MQPTCRIECNGTDITARINDRMVQITITDEAGVKADRVELALDNRDGLLPVPPAEAELRVWFGYVDQRLAYAGRYTFDEVELDGPPETMAIRAKAADLTKGLRKPRTRSFANMTLGAIVGEVAKEHGLSPRVAESLAGVRLEHVDQTEESDVAFLTRLAEENGAVARPADGALLFLERGQRLTASGAAMDALAIARTDITRATLTMSGRGNYAAVTAWHEDFETGQRTAVTVGDADAEGEAYQLRLPSRTAAEAERAGRAKLAEFGRGKAALSVTLPGLPALQAEMTVALSGFGDARDGLWFVKTCTHTLTKGGFTTRFDAEIGGKVAGDSESEGALPDDPDPDEDVPAGP